MGADRTNKSRTDGSDIEKIISIERVSGTVDYNAHTHNYYEMIFIKQGAVQLVFRNKMFVAQAKTLIFISNHEEHSTAVLEGPYERYILRILPEYADKLIMNAKLLSVFKNRPMSFRNVFDVAAIEENLTWLFECILKMMESQEYDNVSSKADFFEEKLGCLIKLVMFFVWENNQSEFPVLRESIKSEIYAVQAYLDQHYRENITIEEVANKFYINTNYLSASFKKLTGYSPKQYLTQNRLSYARYLLLHSQYSIEEIACECGFNDQSNFIRAFKEMYALTPGSLRKANIPKSSDQQ
ncbi:MAG: AraC family transcriptional regulator [Lachnospiraceae bacterium]|nr:AraC family transcriptional regulator [Lachnospiraceae bacterium]